MKTPLLIIKGLLLPALVLTLSSCKKENGQAGHGPGGGFPTPVVTVAPPVQRNISEWDEFTGRVDAMESVEVRPRISGHLDKVNFQSGQLVKKGDVLFAIDPRWNEAAFKNAVATVEQAQARLETAEREAKRADQLSASKAISTEEADTRRSGLTGAIAALHAAEALRDSAALDLDYTQVRSPIDGRVSRALFTTGNHVSGVPGFTTTLTTVVSVDPVYVYVSVDEARFLKYQRLIREKKLGNPRDTKVPAEVQLDGETSFPHKGVIESFDNRIDAATGSIVMRATVPNPDGTLVPGSFARLRIPGASEYPALLVDEKIIGTDQSQKFVLTVGAGNLAEYKPVKLGASIDGMRVVTEGLIKTDRVIISGLQMVRPGAPVSPQETPVAAPKQTAAR